MTMSKTTIPETTGVDMTGLDQAVENVLAEVDRLRALNAELLAALKGILAGFEANVWQRNIDGDNDPAWAIKLLPHLKALADATVAVEKAEGRS